MNIDELIKYTPEELDLFIKQAEHNYIYGLKEINDELYDAAIELYNSKTGKQRKSDVSELPESMVNLPYWMPSLDKVQHNSPVLNRWKTKNKNDTYVVSAKMDGGSALYILTDVGPKLYTRGTYSKGQDITPLIKYLNIPTTSNICVRGELIIPNSIFELKYKDKYSNARALVAGLYRTFNINNYKKNKVNVDLAKDVRFITYEIIEHTEKQMTPEEQLNILNKLGFNYVKHIVCASEDLSYDLLSKLYDDFCKDLDYKIDGLVIYNNTTNIRAVDSRPDYAIAYKKELESLIGFTKVIYIQWNLTKKGILKPVIYIEPIIINNTKINKTTGKNALFIYSNNIGPGTEVKIIRSGDVIPNIAEVITPTKAQMPENYKWTESGIDIYPIDKNPQEELIIRINNFFEILNTMNINRKTIEKITSALSIKTLEEFLLLKEEDINFLGDKISNKIITNVHKSIENANIYTLMAASNLFDGGINLKKLKLIVDTLGFEYLKDYKKEKDEEYISKLLEIKGIADKTAGAFIKGLNEFISFYNFITSNFITSNVASSNVASSISVAKNDKLLNINIIFSGIRDSELEKKILDAGGIIKTTMSKKLNYLIIPDSKYENKKTDYARDNSIIIITIDDFRKFVL